MERELELVKAYISSDHRLFGALERFRQSDEYNRILRGRTPLVSVCVATYNRARLLCERALPSVLHQSYKNIEVLVVGDGCTDDTEKRVFALGDERIRFANLPRRGAYPEDPQRRWMVGGTTAFNHALAMAQGDYITHLDDDDRHEPNRVEALLTFIRQTRADVVYHPFYYEVQGGWQLNNAEMFKRKSVTTSSVFYHNFFNRIGLDVDAHLLDDPGDWNRLRKFEFLGARIARFSDPLLHHYREKNQKS